jgi:hypothetical protein
VVLRVDGDVATVAPGDRAGDGETEAGTTGARVAGVVESGVVESGVVESGVVESGESLEGTWVESATRWDRIIPGRSGRGGGI